MEAAIPMAWESQETVSALDILLALVIVCGWIALKDWL